MGKTEIRPTILKRAKDCCEFCGVKNYSVGHRERGKWNPLFGNSYHDSLGGGLESSKEAVNFVKEYNYWTQDDRRLFVIILTIAHLDHDITNNDESNLKALCQKCHLNYDKEYHKNNARKTMERKKGLLEFTF